MKVFKFLLVLTGCVLFLLTGREWMLADGGILPVLLGLALMIGGVAWLGGFAEDV